MLYYRGRLLDLDNEILSTHAEIKCGSPEEWRYDCYVCSEYRINEADIDVYVIPRIGDMIMASALNVHMFHLPMMHVRRYEPVEIELFDALVNNKVSNCIFPIGETMPFNAKILRIS